MTFAGFICGVGGTLAVVFNNEEQEEVAEEIIEDSAWGPVR